MFVVKLLVIRLMTLCFALAFASSIARASVNHAPVIHHRAHPANSHAPHAAEKHQPHEAAKHAKPQKPPKHMANLHSKPAKIARR
jgi:hypothetical protein